MMSVQEKMKLLTDVLRRAAVKSVPSVTYKLKEPKRRVPPKVRELLKACKLTHKAWKYRQDDSNIHILLLKGKRH